MNGDEVCSGTKKNTYSLLLQSTNFGLVTNRDKCSLRLQTSLNVFENFTGCILSLQQKIEISFNYDLLQRNF